MASTAFIGIGSNLGTPMEHCFRAVDLLRSRPHIRVTALSSWYQSEPVGPHPQDWFINGVVRVETTLDPVSLMDTLLGIERELGRVRREKWGPRIIDLDLLFYDDRVLETKDLTLPHPEAHKRRFVLQPLCEIDAGWIHPVFHKTAKELLKDLPSGEEVRLIV